MAIKYTTESFINKLHEQNRYDIQPIEEYINSKTKIKFQCQCGNIWSTTPGTVLAGKGCPICGKKKANNTKQLKEKFLRNLSQVRPSLTLISEFKTQHDPIDLQCPQGHIWHVETAQNALKPVQSGSKECPYCNKVFLTEENSFGFLFPELIKYLKFQEEAFKYSAYSSKKIIFKCPDCGYEERKTIATISQNKRYRCSNCCDNISFPNKFLRAFLQQLKKQEIIDNYQLEFYLDGYFLDGFFIYKNQAYGIEMHGIQHYTTKFKQINILDQVKRDQLKLELCNKLNIKEIIINCSNSDFTFIKEEFFKSDLHNIFNLDKLDWQEIATNSINNLIKISADLFNQGFTTTEIQNILHISKTTTLSYLKQAENLGWCIFEKWRKKT